MEIVKLEVHLTDIINNAKVVVHKKGLSKTCIVTLPKPLADRKDLQNGEVIILAYLGKAKEHNPPPTIKS